MVEFWMLQFLGVCFFIFISIGSITLVNLYVKRKQYKSFSNSLKLFFWLIMNLFIGIIIFKSFI